LTLLIRVMSKMRRSWETKRMMDKGEMNATDDAGDTNQLIRGMKRDEGSKSFLIF